MKCRVWGVGSGSVEPLLQEGTVGPKPCVCEKRGSHAYGIAYGRPQGAWAGRLCGRVPLDDGYGKGGGDAAKGARLSVVQ